MPDWCKWMAERARRFRRLPPHTRLYLLEAIFYLLIARVALRGVPFRRLTRWFERPPRRPEDTFTERDRLRKLNCDPTLHTTLREEITAAERDRLRKGVQWLIDEAAWFLPGSMACFPRAMAAQVILRRLGMDSTLYYGAGSLPDRGLTAHVWLQDGSEVIVGHHEAQDYHILARYPEPNQP